VAHADDAAPLAATPVPDTVAAAEAVFEPAQPDAIVVRDVAPEAPPPAVQLAANTVTQEEAEPEIASLPIVPESEKNEKPARSVSTLEQGPGASTSPPATEPATRQSSKTLAAAGIAATVAVLGGGLFWWYGAKQSSVPVDQSTQVQASQATSPGNATLAARPSEPAQPIQPPPSPPAQPESGASVASTLQQAPAPVPAPAAAPGPAESAPAAPSLPVSGGPVKPAKPAKPVVQPDPMETKVNELLRKAKDHVAKGQFDKAIATAESVLAIDAGNRAAKALISNAKSRQMEALRSNTSLE